MNWIHEYMDGRFYVSDSPLPIRDITACRRATEEDIEEWAKFTGKPMPTRERMIQAGIEGIR